MVNKMPEHKEREVLRLSEQGVSQRKIAKELNLSKSSVGRALKRLSGGSVKYEPKSEITKDCTDNATFISTSSHKWKTLEDALRAAEVDLTVWKVDRHVINAWDVTMKDPEGKSFTRTNYQIKIWLKLISSESKLMAIESVVSRLMSKPIKLPKPPKKKSGDVMLEICLFDNHFGLLAWDEETNENYDLKIADAFYVNAVYDLLNSVSHMKIDKILFPIGQDFFHINSKDMTTPRANNRLDVDGRFAKVLEAGKMSVLQAIEACRQVANVEVLWIPGNHDPETSYGLIQIAWAYYRNDKRVRVDTSPRRRKHVVYGVSSIGYTHGCDEVIKDLPSIFRDDFPEWSNAQHKEIHIGHYHKKKEMQSVAADTFQSTTVRVIPSLCSTDEWHYSKGYVGKNRAAQSFVWHINEGLLATYYAYARGK